MPQLDPTWFASQIFWLLVTFTALYFILSRMILPAVMGILARRENTITSDIAQAQSSKEQAEEARTAYEKALVEARSRAQELTTQAMLEHKSRMEQASREMDAKTAEKLKEAERRIDAKKRELVEALTPTAAELTGMIVEKLTQQSPANDTVQAVLSELSKSRNG